MGTYKKLKYKKIGPYRIIRKINENAYEVDLPNEYDISPIFNIANIYQYTGNSKELEEVAKDWQ